jgi:hypothetical protein
MLESRLTSSFEKIADVPILRYSFENPEEAI